MKWTWLKRLIGRDEQVESTLELRRKLDDHRPEGLWLVALIGDGRVVVSDAGAGNKETE